MTGAAPPFPHIGAAAVSPSCWPSPARWSRRHLGPTTHARPCCRGVGDRGPERRGQDHPPRLDGRARPAVLWTGALRRPGGAGCRGLVPPARGAHRYRVSGLRPGANPDRVGERRVADVRSGVRHGRAPSARLRAPAGAAARCSGCRSATWCGLRCSARPIQACCCWHPARRGDNRAPTGR